MDYEQIIISGIIGMITFVFFGKFKGKWRIGKVGAIILTLVVIGLWNGVAVPRLFTNYSYINDRYSIEQAFATIPLYQTIQKYEPITYASMVEQMIALRKSGASQQQIIDQLQPKVVTLLLARIRYATDNTLIEHINATLEQMEQLYSQKEQRCFKFLFPQIGGGINTVKLLPLTTIQRRMAADDALIIASYETYSAVNSQQDDAMAKQDLSLIIQQMSLLYGQDIRMLNTPADPNSDREKICEMSIDLYHRVLKLPATRSARIFRMMLTN